MEALAETEIEVQGEGETNLNLPEVTRSHLAGLPMLG